MKSLFVIILGVFPLLAFSADLKGVVVGVSDGDTITVLMNGHDSFKVRFANIDSPEKNQPWGQRSKQALSDLVYRKTVQIQVQDKDRYGRIVGNVLVNGINANKEQIRNGHAWVYRQYLKDQSLLVMEAEAKKAKRGLWSLPEAQRLPPWEWRNGSRKTTKQVSSTTIAATSECGSKRTCKQMTTCAEAKYYLTICGVKTLDGDRDGIPCSSLCK